MKKYKYVGEFKVEEMTYGEYCRLHSKGEAPDEEVAGNPVYRVEWAGGETNWFLEDEFEMMFDCVDTWKDRLTNERDELEMKVSKLRDFVNSKTFDHVSDKQKHLLREQFHHMQCYLDILNDRLQG
jgi:hypothetical protein